MTLIELAHKLRPIIEQAAASLDDKTALDAVTLFPAWNGNGVAYAEGMRLRHEGTLYKVLMPHTSQPDWTPGTAHSLYAKVLIPDENVIPEWEQPDSTFTYKKGDRVTHNGKTWVSDVDNNSWEPGVYGWSEATE